MQMAVSGLVGAVGGLALANLGILSSRPQDSMAVLLRKDNRVSILPADSAWQIEDQSAMYGEAEKRIFKLPAAGNVEAMVYHDQTGRFDLAVFRLPPKALWGFSFHLTLKPTGGLATLSVNAVDEIF